MRYLVTTLLMLGPRLAILLWCADPGRIKLAFQGWPQPATLAFPLLVWPLAGAVLLPWTTWGYLMVAGGGVTGLEWLGLALGLLIDVGAHAVNLYPRRGSMALLPQSGQRAAKAINSRMRLQPAHDNSRIGADSHDGHRYRT